MHLTGDTALRCSCLLQQCAQPLHGSVIIESYFGNAVVLPHNALCAQTALTKHDSTQMFAMCMASD